MVSEVSSYRDAVQTVGSTPWMEAGFVLSEWSPTEVEPCLKLCVSINLTAIMVS